MEWTKVVFLAVFAPVCYVVITDIANRLRWLSIVKTLARSIGEVLTIDKE